MCPTSSQRVESCLKLSHIRSLQLFQGCQGCTVLYDHIIIEYHTICIYIFFFFTYTYYSMCILFFLLCVIQQLSNVIVCPAHLDIMVRHLRKKTRRLLVAWKLAPVFLIPKKSAQLRALGSFKCFNAFFLILKCFGLKFPLPWRGSHAGILADG